VIDPLLAVHIADGVLSWPWLAGGFALAGVLALLACWRLREDEVPRVALMSAAFFVASSIHVKLGPSSVHLLLNGLVGVVLGWRAPLAILLGVVLQALLIPHGGLTTIGVNACTEALPALAAAALFPALLRACRGTWARSLLVGASALLWGGCLVFAAAALWTDGLSGLVRLSPEAGVVVSTEGLEPALAFCRHPATVGALLAFAAVCALAHPSLTARPEVLAGVFVGGMAVVLTLALTGGVLLLDGAETWGRFVSAVFVAHLPLALIEGLILGVTVGFLARVKPALLCLPDPPPLDEATRPLPAPARDTITALIAVGALLLTASPVRAHRLRADRTIDVAKRTVTVESWYETGSKPAEATVRVFRADQTILKEGPLDKDGRFVFNYDKPERLRVVVDAEGGHSTEIILTAKQLGGDDAAAPPAGQPPPPAPESRGRDLLLGLTLLLALGAFVMSCLTARRVRRLAEGREGHAASTSPPGTPPPARPPTALSPPPPPPRSS